MLLAFWRDEDGNELVTWLVIAALVVAIAVAVFGADGTLQTALSGAVTYIQGVIDGVSGTGT
ncbi:hypothetical protein [uncultured Thiohalocapsa sp.]|uniref:hypothetical protein n=1 Tax=uncultured Thiohalocapsa sp. TaxID=768990 RepID=UPI0025CDA3C2|nr:hypothetical protein [uncultured Thiohalocapsa sp.]